MERRNTAAQDLKVEELTPQSKNFNLTAKVISIGDEKEIPNRAGGPPNRVTEAVIGDESANVIFSVWNDQINEVAEGDTLRLENAYVTLVRGHLRVNIGKFGKLDRAEEDVDANADNKNLSDQEHEQPRRDFGRGGFGGGRGGGGGGYRGGGGRGGGFGGGGGRGGGFRY